MPDPDIHRFTLRADHAGGLGGRGSLSTGQLESVFSAASELGGPGEGTNPDELLLAAAGTCYLLTLEGMAGSRQLPLESIELTSTGEVSNRGKGRLRFERIHHAPTLVLSPDATAEQRDAARELATVAESACMVTTALRGNVDITVEPTIR